MTKLKVATTWKEKKGREGRYLHLETTDLFRLSVKFINLLAAIKCLGKTKIKKKIDTTT